MNDTANITYNIVNDDLTITEQFFATADEFFEWSRNASEDFIREQRARKAQIFERDNAPVAPVAEVAPVEETAPVADATPAEAPVESAPVEEAAPVETPVESTPVETSTIPTDANPTDAPDVTEATDSL